MISASGSCLLNSSRDGVDGRDLGKGIACVGGGLVAVHGLAFHKNPPSVMNPFAQQTSCLFLSMNVILFLKSKEWRYGFLNIFMYF